tara:strand:+ start:2200 stop:2568 length:369 start_codon:yes stop_codon:yes gene_type:complete
MYNAYATIGVLAGSGAMTYLAANPNKKTLRLTIGSNNALIYDVRFIGGTVCGLASMFLVKSRNAKSLLGLTSFAAFSSLVSTEVVRWRANAASDGAAYPGGIFKDSMGAMPSYGTYRSKVHA